MHQESNCCVPEVPLFSVITVVYNDVMNIERTICSVLQQQKELFEYIVIDGGSTDGTLEVIKKYSDEIHVLISETDKGIYDAMNKGISFAKGTWVNFMNSGDEFAGNDVLKRVSEYVIPSSVMCVYGDTKLIFKSGSLLKKSTQAQKGFVPEAVHQSTFVRVTYMKNNFFDLKYSLCADYDCMYTMCVKRKLPVLYVPLAISAYDMYGQSQQMMKYYREVADIERTFSLMRFMRFFVKYLLSSIFPRVYENLYIRKLRKKTLQE